MKDERESRKYNTQSNMHDTTQGEAETEQ